MIADTAVLINPPLLELIAQNPEYADLMRDGIIVPAMREGVDSFVDTARLQLARNVYSDLDPDMLLEYAGRLDALKPAIVETRTPANQQLLHDYIRDCLLEASFWEAAGLAEASAAVVDFVPEAMRSNKAAYYRQTEFWQFADKLDEMGEHEKARRVRSHLMILSMGVIAKHLNLHPTYPAAYSQIVS